MTDPQPRPQGGFHNDFGAPIRSFVQAETIQHHHYAPTHAHDFANGRLLIGRVPGLAAGLQDRESDHVLAASLDSGGTAVLCQVLSGMGGVGKTQTAAAYARRAWDAGEIDLLVWASAADRESIIATFAAAAAQVCGADQHDSLLATETFLSWLDRPEAPNWLVVLDDLTDPDDLAGLWPPNTPRGHTIVTTRRRDAALDAYGRSRIDLDLFTQDEASAFLKTRLGAHTTAQQGAETLIEATARLPLALSQAAAFILDQPGMTCARYAELLNDRTVQLAQLRPERLAEEYPIEVAACWAMSIESADREPPQGLADRLMDLASVLDPAGIPVELFTTDGIRSILGSNLDEVIEPQHVLIVLARLNRLSLLDFDGRIVRVHSLIQHAVRDLLHPEQLAVIADLVANALVTIWPATENDPVLCASLRANAAVVRSRHPDGLLRPEAHAVLFYIGSSLGEGGRVAEAAVFFDVLRSECESSLGPDHLDTLVARNNLAVWLGESGQLSEAVAAYETLLEDHLRVLGADHRDTFPIRINLAAWRGELGEVEKAVAEFEVLLEDALRVLGPDDHVTLTTRNNLAAWRGELGDASEAMIAFEALLVDYHRLLGPDHPETMRARSNFIWWRGEVGDPAEAVAAYEALRADVLRVLGPDHPDTLTTRNNLAWWRWAAGQRLESVSDFESVVADRLRVLGPDHPSTSLSIDHLNERRAMIDPS